MLNLHEITEEELHQVPETDDGTIYLEEEQLEMTLEEATEIFGKLRFIESKKQEAKQVAEKEIENIKEWERKQTERFDGIRTYFEMKLTEFYRQQREKNKKFKLDTPYGKVSSRKQKTFHWDEEEVLANNLKQQGKTEAINEKITLDKTKFKKLYPDGVDPETGEVMVRVTEEENVSVKVNDERM